MCQIMENNKITYKNIMLLIFERLFARQSIFIFLLKFTYRPNSLNILYIYSTDIFLINLIKLKLNFFYLEF